MRIVPGLIVPVKKNPFVRIVPGGTGFCANSPVTECRERTGLREKGDERKERGGGRKERMDGRKERGGGRKEKVAGRKDKSKGGRKETKGGKREKRGVKKEKRGGRRENPLSTPLECECRT